MSLSNPVIGSALHLPQQAAQRHEGGSVRELGPPLGVDSLAKSDGLEHVPAHDFLSIDLSGLPVREDGPQGLRMVVVATSEDGPDVVLVCDRHGLDFWFSGVVSLDDAHHTVCERCAEASRLYARRALILDAYGASVWLRVIGREGR